MKIALFLASWLVATSSSYMLESFTGSGISTADPIAMQELDIEERNDCETKIGVNYDTALCVLGSIKFQKANKQCINACDKVTRWHAGVSDGECVVGQHSRIPPFQKVCKCGYLSLSEKSKGGVTPTFVLYTDTVKRASADVRTRATKTTKATQAVLRLELEQMAAEETTLAQLNNENNDMKEELDLLRKELERVKKEIENLIVENKELEEKDAKKGATRQAANEELLAKLAELQRQQAADMAAAFAKLGM